MGIVSNLNTQGDSYAQRITQRPISIRRRTSTYREEEYISRMIVARMHVMIPAILHDDVAQGIMTKLSMAYPEFQDMSLDMFRARISMMRR